MSEPLAAPEASTDDLREQLTRQVLELAIKSDNPQFKLDCLKACVDRTRATKPAVTPSADPMTMFQRRVRQAEAPNGAE